MLVGVLDHDDGGVDHGADGDGDAAEAHDVRAEAEKPHSGKRHQDAHGQNENGNQRAAQMQEEDHADERHDGALLQQRAFQRIHGTVDQQRAVVDRHDRGAGRQADGHLGEPRLDVVDHRERIGAEALQRNAARHLAVAVELGNAAPLVGPDLHPGDVAQQYGRTAFQLHHDIL